MRNKNSSERKQHVEVILVVPLGVDEKIFLWGVHSIKDYLNNTCESIDIKLWDFRSDKYFEELNKRYSNTLGRLLLSLKPEQVNTFYRVTGNPYVFLNLVSFTGDDFFRITGLSRWFRRTFSRNLRDLKSEVEAHIVEKINKYTNKSTEALRLWAFSVYDNSLFSALHIARLIREEDPESPIILGNDAFTFQIAEEVMKGVSFVDGIAVGYGEEIMRMVVSAQQKGIPVCDLRIKGLVNNYFIRNREEAQALREMNIPSFYRDFSNNPLISYVKQPKAGEIRFYIQRGCKWGKCAFCTQYDRGNLILFAEENLHQRFRTEFEAAKSKIKDSPIFIVFDGYEIELAIFTDFIKYLDSIDDLDEPIDVMVFLQIKSFRKEKEFFEVLTNIDNKKIRILLRLHIESLNFDTLRNMRKGNSPLQSIEVIKASQDCGQFVGTSYFTHYPLEDCDGVARETEILKHVAHLLMPPKGGGSTFPYVSNNRDSIYKNQERYKIKIRRLKGDTWLKDVFGIDLPFAYWAHSYRERLSFSLDRLVVWSYYETIKADVAVSRARWIANDNWGYVKTPVRARIALFFRSLKLFIWKILHNSLTLIGKGKVFRKRSQLFKYFSSVLEAQKSTSDSKDSVLNRHKISARMISRKGRVQQSLFFLEDSCLKKEYNSPGKKEKWSKELSSSELKILRYLYWSRKHKDVIEKFKHEIREQDIENIIDRHIKQGSLVQFKDLLLCVVNDPGYWK